jgi:mono/diheme cytochrome c family protein
MFAAGAPALGAERPAAPPRPPEQIYAKVCGYCHGAYVAPIIRGRGLPPETIVQFVRSGPGAMPAFRPTEIGDAELDALARWVSASRADPKEHGQ